MFVCSHCLCSVVINLMFDLEVLLFMLNICNSIRRNFDCGHVSFEFRFLFFFWFEAATQLACQLQTHTGGVQ